MKYLKYFENNNTYYKKIDNYHGIKEEDKSSITDSDILKIERILGDKYTIKKSGSYNTHIIVSKNDEHICSIFVTKDEWYNVILLVGKISNGKLEIYECDQFEGLFHLLYEKIVNDNWYERILKNSSISENVSSEFQNNRITRDKYNEYYLTGLVQPTQSEVDTISSILSKYNIAFELNKKRTSIFSHISISRKTEFNYRIDINKISDDWFIVRMSGKFDDWYYKCDTVSGVIELLNKKIPIFKKSKL